MDEDTHCTPEMIIAQATEPREGSAWSKWVWRRWLCSPGRWYRSVGGRGEDGPSHTAAGPMLQMSRMMFLVTRLAINGPRCSATPCRRMPVAGLELDNRGMMHQSVIRVILVLGVAYLPPLIVPSCDSLPVTVDQAHYRFSASPTESRRRSL